MKISFKKYYYLYLSSVLWCVLLLFSHDTFSQTGISYLTNFSPHDYKGHPQNWSIIQDKNGLIYIGNIPGVLQYDGKIWKLIPVDEENLSRSLAIDKNGRIYVGAQNNFGYLAPDSAGNMHFISLVNNIEGQDRAFTEIWKTHVTSHSIYFQAREKLFELKNDKIKVWMPKTTFHLSFTVKDWLYVTQTGTGLMQVLEDTIIIAGNGEIFSDKLIYSMLPYENNKIFIGTRNHGLYLFDGISSVPFKTKADGFLMKNHHYTGVLLSNGDYALGTLRKGVIILDKKGNIKSLINKTSGLQDENVYASYLDNQDGLWLGLGNGISRVEVSSPLSVYQDASGLKGNVEAIVRHNGVLYTATHQGVFYLSNELKIKDEERGEIEVFKPVPGIKTQAWSLVSINENNQDMLLVSTSEGIYYISDNKANYIRDGTSMSIHRSKKNPDRVFIGLNDGVGSIRLSKGKWINEGNINGFKDNTHMVVEGKNGDVWLATKGNGAYKVSFLNEFSTSPTIEHFDTSNGLPGGRLNIFWVLNDVIFATPKGLYRYKKSNNNSSSSKYFYPDYTFGKMFADGSRNVFYMYEDASGNVWMNSKDENGVSMKKHDGIYHWESVRLKRIPKAAIWAIYNDNNNLTWWGGPEGLVLYNSNIFKNYKVKYPVFIRNVYVNSNKLIFGGNYKDENGNITLIQPDYAKPILKYENNSVKFNFSSPSLDYQSANTFKYLLDGFDENWSDWTFETYKEYTNLTEGNYVFKVKAQNIYDNESTEAVYEFKILPPWYRTIWAYIFYGFLFVGIIYIVVFFSILRLRKAKYRLEKIVRERTHEIVNQYKELEKVNLELEKLSLVASKTHNIVVMTDEKGNIEWANEALTRISGYTFQEFKIKFGKTLAEVSSNPQINELIKESISKKKSVQYESIVQTKEGKELWMSSTLTPILDNEGKVKKIIVIDADITERKKSEEVINQKNIDITDSLEYAKLIQNAILPKTETIFKILKDSFIFFRPRDIVSGDFYWFTVLPTNEIIIAVCDCTGHGVPGAFMSMIGNGLLNQIVLEKKIHNPEDVLNNLSSGIRMALHREGIDTESKDGMDISLCRINFNNKKIYFAGAHRPLFIFQNNKINGQKPGANISNSGLKFNDDLLILHGNKYGIGDDYAYEKNLKYTYQTIDISDGKTIYLFSDGLTDQLGGPYNKKYMAKRFREFLSKIQPLSMQEQVKILEQELALWRGNKPQTDDILVVGIRF